MSGGYGSSLDYVVIAVYMVLIFGLGAVLARYNRTTKDFFMGGQRFSAWVIAMSLTATIVGSYSFVKYSAAAYKHGLAASMTYLNDWFWMPLFMFLWLPIIYYGGIRSVPEYFERRFDRSARGMATVLLLLYMVGYIGINLLTMGKVAAQLLGYPQTVGPVFGAAAVIAVVCAAYVTSGGQAAVILSDVAQGFLLLAAGLGLGIAGVIYVGGPDALWSGLSPLQRLPLAPLNEPPGFNFIGIFWQDGVTNGVWVFFLNQGLMLRFMSGRSADTGRRAAVLVLLLLQVLAVVAVANAGVIGRVLTSQGVIEEQTRADEVFMVVAHLLTSPGVFGFVLAALTAALMSTADTLINATASVWVNDVWGLYVRPGATDRQLLRVGRIASVAVAGIGLLLVPVYMQVGTIYQAHGAFTASIGPPLAAVLMLGLLWKGLTPRGALAGMSLGLLAILVSFRFPEVISPFAMGVRMGDDPFRAYTFQRALYGLVVSGGVAVLVSLFTAPRRVEELDGLVSGPLRGLKGRFKGRGPVHEDAGPVIDGVLGVATGDPDVRGRWPVEVGDDTMRRLCASPGDLCMVRHPGALGGQLRGVVGVLLSQTGVSRDAVLLPEGAIAEAGLSPGEAVALQRML